MSIKTSSPVDIVVAESDSDFSIAQTVIDYESQNVKALVTCDADSNKRRVITVNEGETFDGTVDLAAVEAAAKAQLEAGTVF